MDQIESQSKTEELEKKIDKLQRSIDRLNKIFFWTLVITVIFFVLPLIGLVFVIPKFLSGLSIYGGL